MTEILRCALRLALEPEGSAYRDEAVQRLDRASEEAFAQALDDCTSHDVLALTAHALRAHALGSHVPEPQRERLRAAERTTSFANAIRFRATERALAKLGAVGVEPVLWKGVALADRFYPDPCARPMVDVDFSIPSEHRDEARRALEEGGLERVGETVDAFHMRDPTGVVFDIHWRVRLFEGRELAALTRRCRPEHIDAPSVLVLEPNAMLVHLAEHLHGHGASVGYLLRWVMDFAFVVRRSAAELSSTRIRELCTPEGFALLLRTLGFLAAELGQAAPPPLEGPVAQCPPLTLDEILRSRRLAAWRLDTARGWARLAATRLGLRDGPPLPSLTDLRERRVDAQRTRQAERVAAGLVRA